MNTWQSGLGCLMLIMFVFLAGCVQTQQPIQELTAADHFNLGMSYYQDGEYDSALSEYQQAANKAPRFLDAVYYSGLCYEKKAMPEMAEEAYLECIELDNRYLAARESLGLLYFELERYPEAKQQLESTRSLDSVLPRVYTTLGTIYRMEKDFKRAMTAYQQALDIDSAYLPAQEGIRLTKIQDDTRKETKNTTPSPKKQASHISDKAEKKETLTGGAKALDPEDF